MEKQVENKVTVTMYFDADGELEKVEAHAPAVIVYKGEPGEPIRVADIVKREHQKLKLISALHEYSSPGCITYQTKNGPVTVCWPQ